MPQNGESNVEFLGRVPDKYGAIGIFATSGTIVPGIVEEKS